MTETDTFTALKFGTFTAEDIKHRWVTNDNSKFVSLPNEVKVRWLELLRDRYVAEKVIPEKRTEFINEANQYIKRARSGDYSVSFVSFVSSFSSFFSFYSAFSFSSFSSSSYSISFTEEVMNELAIDSKLLNKAIRENIGRDCLQMTDNEYNGR